MAGLNLTGFRGKVLNLILNYVAFRTNHEPYMVHGMVRGATPLRNNLPTSLKDLEAKGQAVEIETIGLHIHQDRLKTDRHHYKSH